MSTPIHYSRGRDKEDAYPEQRMAGSWEAFAAAVLNDQAQSKGRQYIAAPFKPNGDGRAHRCKAGALESAFIGFDFDGFSSPLEFSDTIQHLQKYQGFAYTTASHAPNAPRARALLAATRAMDRDERKRVSLALQASIEKEIGAGCIKFDQSVYKAEQPMYCPPVGATPYMFKGSPVDVDAVLQTAPPLPPERGKGERAEAIATDDPVLQALQEKEMVLQELEAGKFAIVCPFDQEHTSATSDSSTVYFLPHFAGVKYGKFHCLHDHCANREQPEFLKALGLNPGNVWAKQAAGGSNSDAPPVPTPDPVDLFQAQPVPAFPLDVLPPTFQAYATEHADQSGFDPGAYGFALLIEAANIIDHRARLRITDTWSVPAFQWGALVDPSSGGKSPVMQAAATCSQPIYDEIVQESARALAKWHERCGHLNKNEDAPPKPDWIQRHSENATVEGLAVYAATTPEGVNMRMDEMSEWIGRMDAYHKGSGSQDRASYLKAYNGQSTTITRASRHVHIPNWSVGVLAGIQPEKLAAMFKRSGDAADGLFQRFLTYVFQPAAEADFSARLGRFTRMNAENLFRRLSDMDGPKVRPGLTQGAQMRMQDYVNATRRLATRTASPRLREHIGKFPGFAGRLMLALHVIDAAAAGIDPPGEVPPETFERAQRLLACLYRHSEAVYAEIDGQAQETMSLARTAAEAILAKSWHTFRRGDLTRHATHWRSADHMATEGAIDLLIELGWMIDITERPAAGKRGRRAAGLFQVPPKVHALYAPQAERIRREREERKQALDQVAEARRTEGIS